MDYWSNLCTYVGCKNPANYKWESDRGTLFYTCIDHSKMICELYHSQNESKEANNKFNIALKMAKYNMARAGIFGI